VPGLDATHEELHTLVLSLNSDTDYFLELGVSGQVSFNSTTTEPDPDTQAYLGVESSTIASIAGVTVFAVPEPSTALLMGLGLVALGAGRRG
jgi:hypothetical protein